MPNKMKISELISFLESVKKIEGNCTVCAELDFYTTDLYSGELSYYIDGEGRIVIKLEES